VRSDTLLARGWFAATPCLMQQPCPALRHRHGTGAPRGAVDAAPYFRPARRSHRTARGRECLLRPAGADARSSRREQQTWRVVGVAPPEKGKKRVWICGAEVGFRCVVRSGLISVRSRRRPSPSRWYRRACTRSPRKAHRRRRYRGLGRGETHQGHPTLRAADPDPLLAFSGAPPPTTRQVCCSTAGGARVSTSGAKESISSARSPVASASWAKYRGGVHRNLGGAPVPWRCEGRTGLLHQAGRGREPASAGACRERPARPVPSRARQAR